MSNFSYDSWRTDTASLSEGYSFTVAYRKTPFRVRCGSCDGSRSIGDCRKCQTSTATPAEPGGLPYWASKYGPDLIAYAIYQNIELRMPQSLIAMDINNLFGLRIHRNTINKFKSPAAQSYKHTYDRMLKRLCKDRRLHIDETSITVKEGNGYEAVLTTMEEVRYFYT